MKIRDQIFEETEGKARTLDAQYAKRILDELQNQTGINIHCNPNVDTVLNLLFTEYCDDVVRIMKKYNCDRHEVARSLIFNLCNNKSHEKEYIKRLRLFYDKLSLSKHKHMSVIEGDDGKITFQRFSDWVKNDFVSTFVQSGQCKQRCHWATGVFSQMVPDSIIVTSLVPGRFGGHYYHSYFETQNNIVIDVSNNGMFDKNGYYQYFNPQEVISYPSVELEDRYHELKEKSGDDKVLQLALEHMKTKKY